MPAALATVARQLIIMIVQTGAFIAVQSAFMWVIDKIRDHHAEVNGLDPEDADNATANTIIDIALLAGVTLVSLSSSAVGNLPCVKAPTVVIANPRVVPCKPLLASPPAICATG